MNLVSNQNILILSSQFSHSRLRLLKMYRKVSNIRRTLVGNKNCRSLRCSWSIACRRCSNYIFILDLTSGFKGFGEDSRKTVRESFKCWDLVRLILETWRYVLIYCRWTSHNMWWLRCLAYTFVDIVWATISTEKSTCEIDLWNRRRFGAKWNVTVPYSVTPVKPIVYKSIYMSQG